MPVTVVCDCASTFELKDEFAGALVQCPTCGSTRRAGPAHTPEDLVVHVPRRGVILDRFGRPLVARRAMVGLR